MCRNRGSAISDQETSCQGPRREEARCSVFWEYEGKDYDRITPGYASSKSHGQMLFSRIWQHQASADMLVMQRNRCTSTQPTQKADSRADATSAQNASRPNCAQFQSSKFLNHQFAGRICIFIYISSTC